MEIEILLETNRYLGTKETAQHVFDLLCSYNHIIPTHFGTDEPLRNTFADNKDKFVELWSSQDTFGCVVIWQRNIQPEIEGMALFGKSRYPEFNKLSWTISVDSFDLTPISHPSLYHSIIFESAGRRPNLQGPRKNRLPSHRGGFHFRSTVIPLLWPRQGLQLALQDHGLSRAGDSSPGSE